MPYTKIKSGKNKGKYRSKESGRVMTLGQIRAYQAKKRGRKK
ncbi:hypothetical protein [Vibrio phage VP41s3]|nr:hypothetical protein [Vibrio phage VP41s3]